MMQNLGGKHISKRFDRDIKQLIDKVATMIDSVENALEGALQFYEKMDEKLLLELRKIDQRVNKLQSKIESLCLELIVKHSPMANDLRIVFSIIKIASNLERMGDQYLKFSEQTKQFSSTSFYKNTTINECLRALIQTTADMLEKVKCAFLKGDVQLALVVVKHDERVDKIYRDLLQEISRELVKNSSQDMAAKFTDFIIAIRALERFGDHAVNIASLVIYAVENEDVAHYSYSQMSKILSQDSFDE